MVAILRDRIEHIDLTVICDQPGMVARYAEMAQRAAALLSVPLRRISIKHAGATDLGFVLRPRTLAAQCLATVNYLADL